MKILLVYYSWSGNTRKLAQKITSKVKCDVEEIYETGKRDKRWVFLTGGFEALFGGKSRIEKPKRNPSDYDFVLLGGPVWAGRISPAMRSYLFQCGKVGDYAVFMTEKGDDPSKALKDLKEMVGKEPAASLIVREKDIAGADIQGFLGKIMVKSP